MWQSVAQVKLLHSGVAQHLLRGSFTCHPLDVEGVEVCPPFLGGGVARSWRDAPKTSEETRDRVCAAPGSVTGGIRRTALPLGGPKHAWIGNPVPNSGS